MNSLRRLCGFGLVLLVLALVPSITYAQLEDPTITWNPGGSTNLFTTTRSGGSIDLRNTSVRYHVISWHPMGTTTTCEVKIEKSTDNSSFSDLVVAQDCTTPGSLQAATFDDAVNYVRVTVSVLSGGGNVRVKYDGYINSPDGPSGVTISGIPTVKIDQTTPGTTNKVTADVTHFGGVAVTPGDPHVQGDTAHDSADGGNPVKIGGKAISYGTTVTAVTANDRTDQYFDRAGIPWVIPSHPDVVSARLVVTSVQSNVAVVTVSAGTKIVVVWSYVNCSAAVTNTIVFTLGFGTATTPTTSKMISDHSGLLGASGAGVMTDLIVAGADDEDVRLTMTDPDDTCSVTVWYYTIAG